MKFDPAKYETVKHRKKRFYEDYDDGRIVVELLNPNNVLSEALVRAQVFKTAEDQKKNLPFAVGHALEIRDKEISISNSGMKYKSVNYTSWTENAEESAVGRALDNAGYASNGKCSLEEKEKADRMGDTNQSLEKFDRNAVLGFGTNHNMSWREVHINYLRYLAKGEKGFKNKCAVEELKIREKMKKAS